MKSVSHPVKKKKFKTVQDIVHSQDLLLLRHKAGQEGRGEILLENSFMR